jgi:hypothetical protein
MVKITVFEESFDEAVIVTLVGAVTDLVGILKLTAAVPAFTVTLAGTVAKVPAETDKEIISSFTGVAFKVTIPTAEVPLTTEAGETVSDNIPGGGGIGIIVRLAVFSEPFRAAVMDALTEAVTVLVGISKLADVAPAATPTLAGKINTSFWSADSAIVAPSAGAARFKVIVPTAEVPLIAESGETVNEEMTGGGGATGTQQNRGVSLQHLLSHKNPHRRQLRWGLQIPFSSTTVLGEQA